MRLQIIDSPTNVDCTRELRHRRTLRSFIECLLPYCCTYQNNNVSISSSSSSDKATNVVMTGTFFGQRRGHVSFCLQQDTRSSSSSSPPLLLLELAVPTTALAREMEEGFLRIALRSRRSNTRFSIFDVPVWSMYCNGRKVGFAVKREMNENDVGFLRMMESVSVGAGVVPDGEMLYLRGKFERVAGSSDSESFHMVNPEGSYGQELSIFLLRS